MTSTQRYRWIVEGGVIEKLLYVMKKVCMHNEMKRIIGNFPGLSL